MQDIGPDMEELFRRASEDYPLKQGEDKWSEIASKINDKPIPQPAYKQQTRYRKYYAVLLFLLMFLSLDFFFSRPVPNQNADLQKLPKNEIKQVNNHTKTNKAIDYKILEEPTYKNKSTVSKNNFNGVILNLINRNIEQHLIITKAGIQEEKIKNLQSVNQPINFTNDFEMNKVLDRSTPSVMNIKDLNPIKANNFSLSNINSSDTGSSAEQFTSLLSNSAEKKVTNKTSIHSFYYGLLLGTELNSIKNQDMKKVVCLNWIKIFYVHD